MNYWPRWINAIKKRTAGLSLAEMGAYDRLLDHYYAEEAPLPADPDECCRLAVATTKDERRAVEKVLAKFFTLTPDGYRNERADEEIALAGSGGLAEWFSALPQEKRTAMQASRRARTRQAQPQWLTQDQRRQIDAIYADSALRSSKTGVPHHVDHIVPLAGKTVCGLHVPWNLQVIEAAHNIRKGAAT